MGSVILRSQQATKNLHLLENTKCRSFAQKKRRSVEQGELSNLFSLAYGVAMFMTLGGPAGPSPLRMAAWMVFSRPVNLDATKAEMSSWLKRATGRLNLGRLRCGQKFPRRRRCFLSG